MEIMSGICTMLCQAEQMTDKHKDLIRLEFKKSMNGDFVTAKFQGDKPDQVFDVTFDDGDGMIQRIATGLK